jgi:hypothetical protein
MELGGGSSTMRCSACASSSRASRGTGGVCAKNGGVTSADPVSVYAGTGLTSASKGPAVGMLVHCSAPREALSREGPGRFP